MATVPIPALRAAMEERAAALGYPADEAALLVDHFVDAEMRGARGHGVERLRWLAGFAPPQGPLTLHLEDREEGLARYDAGGSLGYLALAAALDLELAAALPGARLVVVRRCFPTGRLGWFAQRAARAGAVCLLTATSTARISHPQGGPPLLGTNPLCLALPGEPEPAVIDVSMGRITYGAVLKAAAEGRDLPPGAAIAPNGSPVTDPAEITADRAGIVPFGADQAHKGFALALLVETLCRSLAGEDGHAAVALLAHPQAAPFDALREASGGLRFPGERSAAVYRESVMRGTLEVPDDLWAWISDGLEG